VLTVSVNGFGKRTSSYEYRTTGRGGKGIVAMSVNNRNGKLVASFPVEDSDQIMLVTDKGQLIRCPVEGIRVAGRSTQGVIVFDTAEDEHVVSVEHIGDDCGAWRPHRCSSKRANAGSTSRAGQLSGLDAIRFLALTSWLLGPVVGMTVSSTVGGTIRAITRRLAPGIPISIDWTSNCGLTN
jgi:hypothetical protein